MKYLLIDETSLFLLIDTNGYSDHLLELKDLLHREEISLITHKLIIQEWENHKTKTQKDKEGKLFFDVKSNIN